MMSLTARTKRTLFQKVPCTLAGPAPIAPRLILNNPDLPTAEANAYWTDPQGNGPLERSFNFMAEWLNARY
jgi:hypothetical protein